MKISTRIVALVLVGFLVTLSVAGVAVVFMSRMSEELDDVSNKDLPLVRSLATIVGRQLELATSLERALREGSSAALGGEGGQSDAFEEASFRFRELAYDAEDELRIARDQVREALRRTANDERRTALRFVLSTLQEIGLVFNQHAGLAQQTFFLIESGNPWSAAKNVPDLEDQQVVLSVQMAGLVDLITGFAKSSAATTYQNQQEILVTMVAVSCAGLLACILLGLSIGRGVTRPVKAMTGALAKFARGNIETPIDLPDDNSEMGAMAASLKTFRDEIIFRRETIVALAASEQRFHALAEVSPVGVFYTDDEGNGIYMNEKCCEITGLSGTETLGRGWSDRLHPDDRERVLAEIDKGLREDTPSRSEYRFLKPDGTVTWVLGQSTPHRNSLGQTTGIVGTITDISEQKQAEAKLIEYAHSRIELHEITADRDHSLDEKIQRLLVLGTKTFGLPVGIVSRIKDQTYRIKYVHGPEGSPPPGTLFSLGKTYCFHTLNSNGPLGFHEAGKSDIKTHPCYLETGLEAYLGCPLIVDGTRYGTLNFSGPEVRQQPFDDGDFSLIQVFAQWIGYEISRSRTEDALRESGEQIRAVVDNVVDGIITIDDRGIIQTVNPAVEKIFGYNRNELIGENIKKLMPTPHREAHDRYLSNYAESGQKNIIGFGRELEGLHKDGSVFPIDLAVSEGIGSDHQMYTGIIRDITERKQVERMKQEFVSSVSHELRTPLTSIRGALGLIVGGVAGKLDKKNKNLIEIAFNNTQRLINLVNDILDLEKIGAGRMEFRFKPVDLASLIGSTLIANEGYANEHGIRFKLLEAPPAPPVQVDEDRIGQVMANLLSNAAKFSPKGETVSVSVIPREGWIRVSVADCGSGIPKLFHERIFERFSQADSSDAKKAGGTGLGLSIAKAIVDRHGGRIGFDTEVGVGTTFHFDLPAEAPVSAGDEAARSEPQYGNGVRKRYARVLICEDDPDIAKLLLVLLEKNDIEADIAYDAATAKSLLAQKKYDAMTVDILLPDQDGLSLIRDIRGNERTRNLPIVIISVQAKEARDKIEASALGILDWLEKPIDETRLRSALDMATRRNPENKPRLLYVEDDPDLVEVVTTLVSDTVETIVATTLAEARRLLRENTFDLVILDVQLPDGSGLDLLKSLKDEKGQPTPVIVFSGEEVDEDLARRVDAALVKSRTSDRQLIKIIRTLIGVAERAPEDHKEVR